MADMEKTKYEYLTIRPLAILGILGVIGLTLSILSFQFAPPFQWILLVISVPLAVIGLWLGAAYFMLYKTAFRVAHAGPFWASKTGFLDTLRGTEEILDVGCGTGRIAIGIAKQLTSGSVVGIDIFEWVSGNSPDMPTENARIEGVSDRTEFQYGDATDIPFEDARFDIVTMDSVLHEIEEDELKVQALAEVNRVLKPGGRFVTQELIRNRKMFAWLLFFAFVFKPLEYWNALFGGYTDFEIGEPHIIKGPIDFVVYIMTKPN